MSNNKQTKEEIVIRGFADAMVKKMLTRKKRYKEFGWRDNEYRTVEQLEEHLRGEMVEHEKEPKDLSELVDIANCAFMLWDRLQQENKCDCYEMTCKKGCTKNHTHKGFSCDICENLEDITKEVIEENKEVLDSLDQYDKGEKDIDTSGIEEKMNDENKYKIIYADPPWTYPKTGGTKNSRGMAKQFYNTMSLDDIRELDIESIADDDCVLFLWSTYPQLPNALKVIESWGFTYYGLGFEWIKKTKTGKDFFGMGYWTRANPECCLMAIKGKPKPISHSVRQLTYAQLDKHSKKPIEVKEKIIELCGDLPRVELFAREKTEGWDVWGNEVESDIEIQQL